MKQYICLASEPWSTVPSRTQHLMSRLRDTQVLYFEPPTSGGERRQGYQARPGLTVYTLPSILEVEERYSYLFRRGLSKTAKFIRAAAERHRFREPVLWLTAPRQVHLLDLIAHRGLVYDCDREWTGLPIRWESDLTLAADVVFTASPLLAERLAPCSDNIAILPNGANYAMFSRAPAELPPELARLRRPLLGYAGTLWRDLDLSPVWDTARRRPDWTFVLVGRVDPRNDLVRELEQLPNVALLGQRPLVDLPDYLGRFDVCLDLYRRRNIGGDIVPPRLFEYFSTGKPVVSMLWEDQVEFFPDVVYSAHTHPEFEEMCARALTEVGSWARARRLEYARGAAWSERGVEVCRILQTNGLF